MMPKIGRNSWVRREWTTYIELPNVAKQRRLTDRLRKKNAAVIERAEAWRKTFRIDEQPALLIRMNETAEGIPSGILIELPREYSTALIRVRASVPVGDLNVEPTLVVTEDELFTEEAVEVEAER